jgi:hypothetical protein
MKKLEFILFLQILVTSLLSQQSDFPSRKLSGLMGPHLGQKLPEMAPEQFGVGIIDSN